MCDHKGGAVAQQRFETLPHDLFGLGVEIAEGLVEQNDWCVAQHGAGDGDALPLPAGKTEAAPAYRRVVALGQAFDELGRVGRLRRAPDG